MRLIDSEQFSVVHCKDCKHLYFKDFSGVCPHRVSACRPDGFCECGERCESVSTYKQPIEEENVEALASDAGTEKRNIMQHLKDYRAAHGHGCLDLVAQKTSRKKEGRIPVETLRDIVAGNIPKMPLSEWRKISKALCSIEGVISISNA